MGAHTDDACTCAGTLLTGSPSRSCASAIRVSDYPCAHAEERWGHLNSPMYMLCGGIFLGMPIPISSDMTRLALGSTARLREPPRQYHQINAVRYSRLRGTQSRLCPTRCPCNASTVHTLQVLRCIFGGDLHGPVATCLPAASQDSSQ